MVSQCEIFHILFNFRRLFSATETCLCSAGVAVQSTQINILKQLVVLTCITEILKTMASHLFIECCFETQITRTHQEFLECFGTWLWSWLFRSIGQLTNGQLYRVAFVRLVIGTISDIRRQLIVNPAWLTTATTKQSYHLYFITTIIWYQQNHQRN